MVEPSELDAILGALLVPDNEQIRHVDLRFTDPLDKKNHAFTESHLVYEHRINVAISTGKLRRGSRSWRRARTW